ncbi:MAG TPA: hypothetical protein VHQ87_07775, partial [Rhizobacter sp.]|nr:hypothetical protein [Rhizobacter sp.]
MAIFPSAFSRTTAVLLLAGSASATHATFITFDEHPWVDGPGGHAFDSNPITGWYDALGVDLGSAYLQPADSSPNFSHSQYILGPNSYRINFTGTLPSYVSLNFSSPLYDLRSTVTAEGANGQVIGSADTGGQYFENGSWVSSPYNPRSFASFHSDGGISHLLFYTEPGGFRLEAKLDNLYFGNVPAVPEPATIALW